ncbi:hypothetical protein ACI2LF_08640 [Kribbella sp. NPDC020789]
MPDVPTNQVHDRQVALLASTYTHWQRGETVQAMQALQKHIKDIPDDLPMLILSLWLSVQAGQGGFPIGIELANVAIERGKPWLARNFVNSLLSNIIGTPDLIPQAIGLAKITNPYSGSAPDLAGIAWSLIANGGHSEAALSILELAASESQPGDLALSQLNEYLRGSHEIAQNIATQGTETLANIRSLEAELETKAKQAEVLIESVASGTINSRFESDAQENKLQSDRAFKWGMIILAAASIFAVLPIALHYFNIGLKYNAVQVLGAHASATLALGAVAGVLLTRARHRDRARQRAADLSTAMGTIIVYSNQIQSVDERQRFMQAMGQLVLVAHLQADQSGTDQPTVSLSSVLTALRTPTQQ